MPYTDPDHEQELLDWERGLREQGDPQDGDPRRCPRHPHVRTSSNNGLFDGLCGECEAEMDEAAANDAHALDLQCCEHGYAYGCPACDPDH